MQYQHKIRIFDANKRDRTETTEFRYDFQNSGDHMIDILSKTLCISIRLVYQKYS